MHPKCYMLIRVLATSEDEKRWVEDEWANRLMELEEHMANRVDKLEERLAKLEQGMVKMNNMNVRVETWKMFLGKVALLGMVAVF